LNFYVGQVINDVIRRLIFRKQRGKSIEFITGYLVLFRRGGVLPTEPTQLSKRVKSGL